MKLTKKAIMELIKESIAEEMDGYGMDAMDAGPMGDEGGCPAADEPMDLEGKVDALMDMMQQLLGQGGQEMQEITMGHGSGKPEKADDDDDDKKDEAQNESRRRRVIVRRTKR